MHWFEPTLPLRWRALVAIGMAAVATAANAQVAVTGNLAVATGSSSQTWYGNVAINAGSGSFTINGNLTIVAPTSCTQNSNCASGYCAGGFCGMAPPQIAITGITNGEYINAAPVGVCYTVTDPFLVSAAGTLDGAPMIGGCASAYTELPHTVVVTASNVGGSATTAREAFTIDLTPATVSVVSPLPRALVGTTAVSMTASASDLNGVAAVQVASSSPGALSLGFGADGYYHGTIGLNEGDNLLTVTAIDLAGNAATTSISVTRDTTPPWLTVTAPADGAVVPANTVVNGTVSDASAVSVTVNGANVPVGAGGMFSTTVQLANGANTITLRATDAALNTRTVTRNVQVGQGAIYYCYDGAGNITSRISCNPGATCSCP
jgi:hypothetical protein